MHTLFFYKYIYIYMYLHLLTLKYKCIYTYKEYVLKKSTINMIYICIYICLLNSKYIYIYIYLYIHTIYIYICICTVFRLNTQLKKCFGQLPDIPALHRTSQGRCRTSQVSDIPGAGHPRCRTSRPCAGHLKAGAGHPGLAPDISRQVPDIPGAGHPRCWTSRPCAGHLRAGAGHPRCRTSQVPDIPALRRTSQGRFRTSQGRCRTSRPCAGHLKAGAGHLKTGTGHPGQALDFLMNSIKDHKSSPRSKSLTLPVANWPTECLRTKPSTLLGSHSFLLLSKVSFSSS